MTVGRLARGTLSAAILALAALQIVLTWDFWGTFGGDSQALTLVFQGIGASLALIEALALLVAGHAAERGEKTRATAARLLFVPLFLVNLAGDIGAIAAFSAAEETRRGQLTAAYDQNARVAMETGREIERLEAELDGQGLNLPATALRPPLDLLAARIERLERAGVTVPRNLRAEHARLESALATATEMESAKLRRDQALADNARIGERPADAHPQFEALAALARDLGIPATPESVRVWLAAGVGLVVKLWLAFGLWAASVRAAGEQTWKPVEGKGSQPNQPQLEEAVPEQPAATPAAPRARAGGRHALLDEIWGRA